MALKCGRNKPWGEQLFKRISKKETVRDVRDNLPHGKTWLGN